MPRKLEPGVAKRYSNPSDFENVHHVIGARTFDNLEIFDGGGRSGVLGSSLRGGGRKGGRARGRFLRLSRC